MLDEKTEVGRRKAEDGSQKTEGGRRKTEGGRRRSEDGRRKTEGSKNEKSEVGNGRRKYIPTNYFSVAERSLLKSSLLLMMIFYLCEKTI
jgi:hypothetical protein